MNDRQIETTGPEEAADRAVWQRPEVKRLVAGEAEASGSPVADVVFS